MNAVQFRELVAGRVPAWTSSLTRLEELTSLDPVPEVLLKPGEGLDPFAVQMLLEVLDWSGEMLLVRVIVGDRTYFGRQLSINPAFLGFFRIYVAHPLEIHRSQAL